MFRIRHQPEPRRARSTGWLWACERVDGVLRVGDSGSEYADVVEGYHLDKRHWITVTLNGDVPDALVRELVEDSYDLVAAKAPARSR